MNTEKFGTLGQTTTNSLGATYQFQSWLRNNNYHKIEDIDGSVWQLEVESQLGPNPEDIQGGLWTIRVKLEAKVSAAELVESNLLDKDNDSRLLGIIGESLIPMVLNRPSLKSSSIEDARRSLVNEINSVRQVLKSKNLSNIKRTLVGKWVENQKIF